MATPKVTAEMIALVRSELGRKAGLASAKALTKKERIERARAAGKASGGWPKGKKRGPRKAKKGGTK